MGSRQEWDLDVLKKAAARIGHGEDVEAVAASLGATRKALYTALWRRGLSRSIDRRKRKPETERHYIRAEMRRLDDVPWSEVHKEAVSYGYTGSLGALKSGTLLFKKSKKKQEMTMNHTSRLDPAAVEALSRLVAANEELDDASVSAEQAEFNRAARALIASLQAHTNVLVIAADGRSAWVVAPNGRHSDMVRGYNRIDALNVLVAAGSRWTEDEEVIRKVWGKKGTSLTAYYAMICNLNKNIQIEGEDLKLYEKRRGQIRLNQSLTIEFTEPD